MTYLFLLYGDESQSPEPPQDEAGMAAYMAPWNAYNQMLRDEGVFLAGEALLPTAAATTVTATTGESVWTDGPFAETREQLGGFYMVDAQDLDHAMRLAAQCPMVHFGRVEVRPVMALDA